MEMMVYTSKMSVEVLEQTYLILAQVPDMVPIGKYSVIGYKIF